MKYALLSLLFLSSMVLFSCKKNSVEDPVDHSSAYIPMKVGSYWIYQMDSAHYAGTGAPTDSFNYQLKHQVVESITDGLGGSGVRIEVSSRKDTGYLWEFARAYQIVLNAGEFQRTDFNIKEVILNIPILNNKDWDGNTYNTGEEAIYFISEAHQAFELGSFSFDSCVLVNQEEQINLVNRYKGEERYAKNVGLIYRHKERLSNLVDPDKISGYQFTMTLIDYKP